MIKTNFVKVTIFCVHLCNRHSNIHPKKMTNANVFGQRIFLYFFAVFPLWEIEILIMTNQNYHHY